MRESEWTKILRWPGYRVYCSEINEESRTPRLWVRRKRGSRKLQCSGCGRTEIAEVYERVVRDLPWSEYRTTVVIERYRVCCPDSAGSRARKCHCCRARRPSASVLTKQWVKLVRARRYDEWPGSLAWRRARCERSTYVISGVGQRGD